MISVYSQNPEDLQDAILQAGFPVFRFKQLMQWLYSKAENDLACMTDLPKDFKTFLAESYSFALPEVQNTFHARDCSSKFVLQLQDGNLIEYVLMPEEGKNTLCLSSQVGCAFGCNFCATGRLSLIRNLTTDEIIGQIILAKRFLQAEKLTNLVFMGMGEPLANLNNVLSAIRIVHSNYSLQFSPRRITVSTCGLVPKIYELADTGVKVKLAVSLNSAIDSKRNQIMPVNKTYNLAELKKAVVYFRKNSPWRITLEYIMIPDFNMGEEDAKALLKFAGDLSCKINLIAYNPVKGFPWRNPTRQEALSFQDRLRELPVAVTIRKSRGTDISAACGQLAAQVKLKRGHNERS